MITGTGIDMIEVARIVKRISSKYGFREKVFSANEIAYCELQKNKAENYAARFAAKEAFLKATGEGLYLGYELHEIEIVNDAAGKPSIQLTGNFRKLAKQRHWNKIHVSLSNLGSMACAMVIIEK